MCANTYDWSKQSDFIRSPNDPRMRALITKQKWTSPQWVHFENSKLNFAFDAFDTARVRCHSHPSNFKFIEVSQSARAVIESVYRVSSFVRDNRIEKYNTSLLYLSAWHFPTFHPLHHHLFHPIDSIRWWCVVTCDLTYTHRIPIEININVLETNGRQSNLNRTRTRCSHSSTHISC